MRAWFRSRAVVAAGQQAGVVGDRDRGGSPVLGLRFGHRFEGNPERVAMGFARTKNGGIAHIRGARNVSDLGFAVDLNRIGNEKVLCGVFAGVFDTNLPAHA